MTLDVVNRLKYLCDYDHSYFECEDGDFCTWEFDIYKAETKDFKSYCLMKRFEVDDNGNDIIVWELFIDDDNGISCDYDNAVSFNEIDDFVEAYKHIFHSRNEELEKLLEKYAVASCNRKEFIFI